MSDCDLEFLQLLIVVCDGEINPGAQSVLTVIGPECLMEDVRIMRPPLRLSAFSDLTSLALL